MYVERVSYPVTMAVASSAKKGLSTIKKLDHANVSPTSLLPKTAPASNANKTLITTKRAAAASLAPSPTALIALTGANVPSALLVITCLAMETALNARKALITTNSLRTVNEKFAPKIVLHVKITAA